MKTKATSNNIDTRDSIDPKDVYEAFGRGFSYPGLTPGFHEIGKLIEDFPKRVAVHFHKRCIHKLWVVFLGGTGTGKSTLFNAVCGQSLSETGVERPKTSGPVAYAGGDVDIGKDFPIETLQVERISSADVRNRQTAGAPGRLSVIEHRRKGLDHLVIVDSPDVDSVEPANRRIAEDLFMLSDVIVFLTSQEKYSDKVPSRFLKKIIQEGKRYCLVVNKAETTQTAEEIGHLYSRQGIPLDEDRVWFIPYVAPPVAKGISEHGAFKAFVQAFLSELKPESLETVRQDQNARTSRDVARRAARLADLLRAENRAVEAWRNRLDELCRNTSIALIESEKQRFMAKSSDYLKSEVRRLFSRYDVLAKPRMLIREVLLTPLRFFGIGGAFDKRAKNQSLHDVGRKMDLTPVLRAVESLNRSVIENLSPRNEDSLLYQGLRNPDIILKDTEAEEHIRQEQDRLAEWLEETFNTLAKEIPLGKKWGIYSTSVLWGILILSLEIVIGGGFSIIDAALDSAIAPFVTKGAVELFAYQEIRKITQELAERHRKGLLYPLECQRNRYADCIQALMVKEEAFHILERLGSR